MINNEEIVRYVEAYMIASKFQIEVDIEKLEKRLGFENVSSRDYKKIEKMIRHYKLVRED